MKRRTFLSSLMGAALGAAGNPMGPLFRVASAQTFSGTTLVVVFQRGGCDGLNTVVPYGDPSYRGLRPTIGIEPPNLGDAAAALDLDGSFFGLHPSLAPFMEIYGDNNLAVLPTVHYPNASRSHFTGQDWIERAAPDNDEVPDGWLNRHLVSTPMDVSLRAAAIGSSLPQSLKGSAVVSSFDRLVNFQLGLPAAEEELLLDSLSQVYGQVPDESRPHRELVQEFGRVVFNDLSVVADLNPDPASYEPSNDAQYPNSTFGRQMEQIAILVKAGVGLELATLNIGGWDNHSGQGGGEATGRQARRHADFSGGIRALYRDLGALMDNVIILTMTEFGRTAKENGSLGSDHGNASSWFLAGNRVNGGIYGAWPGLTTDDLYRDRYLKHTVDFRDVLGDVLSVHLGSTGAALGEVLPEHNYQTLNLIT